MVWGFFVHFCVFGCWFFFNQMLFQRFYSHDQEAMAQFFFKHLFMMDLEQPKLSEKTDAALQQKEDYS